MQKKKKNTKLNKGFYHSIKLKHISTLIIYTYKYLLYMKTYMTMAGKKELNYLNNTFSIYTFHCADNSFSISNITIKKLMAACIFC